jgi:hypothetical protein
MGKKSLKKFISSHLVDVQSERHRDLYLAASLKEGLKPAIVHELDLIAVIRCIAFSLVLGLARVGKD